MINEREGVREREGGEKDHSRGNKSIDTQNDSLLFVGNRRRVYYLLKRTLDAYTSTCGYLRICV